MTEEDYLRPSCDGQWLLQPWRITDQRNPDGTIKLELLVLWTTELNELMDGTGLSNPLGLPTTVNCSAHWFDVSGRSSPRAGKPRATAAGEPYENFCIGVFTLRDGRIAAVREYMDTGYARRTAFAPRR